MSTELRFSHKLDYLAVQYASHRDLVMLASITGGQFSSDRQRAPLDLVAVLDRCGAFTDSQTCGTLLSPCPFRQRHVA